MAAKAMEELGTKSGVWTIAASYESSVITTENLKQYEGGGLDSTTGFFLDDDASVMTSRDKALLDFVRSGKGLAGIHAAVAAHHKASDGPEIGGMVAAGMLAAADKDEDKTLDAAELQGLADNWFDAADSGHSGKVSVQDFKAGFAKFVQCADHSYQARRQGGRLPRPDHQYCTWPDFNK
jgi:hypothetical protein